jgi:hypothetical protein
MIVNTRLLLLAHKIVTVKYIGDNTTVIIKMRSFNIRSLLKSVTSHKRIIRKS